jgi:RNA ligase
MNFFTYLGVSPQEFQEQYIETDYVSQQKHAEFPLVIYAYGRKTVKEQKWDAVTSKCRGIVVNRETGEVVARPFEKFHNFGSPQAGDITPCESA